MEGETHRLWSGTGRRSSFSRAFSRPGAPSTSSLNGGSLENKPISLSASYSLRSFVGESYSTGV